MNTGYNVMTCQRTALSLCSCVDCQWFSIFFFAFRIPLWSSKPGKL